MTRTSQGAFATAMLDQMVAARFGRLHGTTTFLDYCEHVNRRSTAHLDDHLARQALEAAGTQRRRARFVIENTAILIVRLPMTCPRTGQPLWAEMEAGIYLDLLEMGATGAWFFAHKGKDRSDGQVCTKPPLWRSSGGAGRTAVARLIVGAGRGQQARRRDRNPMNLRRDNLYLTGNPATVEGKAGTARTDTVANLKRQAAARDDLAGCRFGMPVQC